VPLALCPNPLLSLRTSDTPQPLYAIGLIKEGEDNEKRKS